MFESPQQSEVHGKRLREQRLRDAEQRRLVALAAGNRPKLAHTRIQRIKVAFGRNLHAFANRFDPQPDVTTLVNDQQIKNAAQQS